MDIKNLQTLKVIVEMGSFQKAAYKLNYAQSTVTTQIQQLEQELDIQLFEKIGRKICLTSAGKDLLPLVNNILESVDVMKNYGKDNNDFSGQLRIAIPETLLTYKLQPILKKIHQTMPNVKLSFKTMNCYDIPQEINRGSVDLGICYDTNQDLPNLVTNAIWDHDIRIVSSVDSDISSFVEIDLENQSQLCLLTNDTDSIYQKRMDDLFDNAGIQFPHTIEMGSIEAVKGSVMNDLGIAVLPQFVVENEVKNGQMKEITSPLNDDTISTIYAYHKNKWLSPAMIEMIKLLEESA